MSECQSSLFGEFHGYTTSKLIHSQIDNRIVFILSDHIAANTSSILVHEGTRLVRNEIIKSGGIRTADMESSPGDCARKGSAVTSRDDDAATKKPALKCC